MRQQVGSLTSKLGFMPSEEFIAHQKAMAEAAAANPPPEFKTEQERRDHIDNMLGQRPLADGVVARELDADGVFAIGLAPEDVAENAPGICYFHGDGYLIGSAKAWQPCCPLRFILPPATKVSRSKLGCPDACSFHQLPLSSLGQIFIAMHRHRDRPVRAAVRREINVMASGYVI